MHIVQVSSTRKDAYGNGPRDHQTPADMEVQNRGKQCNLNITNRRGITAKGNIIL